MGNLKPYLVTVVLVVVALFVYNWAAPKILK
jgi:hypothetical protein